jgi:hypothetical protein
VRIALLEEKLSKVARTESPDVEGREMILRGRIAELEAMTQTLSAKVEANQAKAGPGVQVGGSADGGGSRLVGEKIDFLRS